VLSAGGWEQAETRRIKICNK